MFFRITLKRTLRVHLIVILKCIFSLKNIFEKKSLLVLKRSLVVFSKKTLDE